MFTYTRRQTSCGESLSGQPNLVEMRCLFSLSRWEMGMKMKVRCCNDSPSFFDERLVREQRTMSNVPVFVGLDYHQDSIQVCVLNQKGDVLLNRSAKNDCQEVGHLVGPLGIVQRVGIEACCGAADFGEEL